MSNLFTGRAGGGCQLVPQSRAECAQTVSTTHIFDHIWINMFFSFFNMLFCLLHEYQMSTWQCDLFFFVHFLIQLLFGELVRRQSYKNRHVTCWYLMSCACMYDKYICLICILCRIDICEYANHHALHTTNLLFTSASRNAKWAGQLLLGNDWFTWPPDSGRRLEEVGKNDLLDWAG